MPGLDVFYAADVCYEHDVSVRHGVFYRCLPRYRLYSAFERAIFSPDSHTHILSIVESEKEFCKAFYKTPEERFHAVPPGISRDRMAPDNASEIRAHVRSRMGLQQDDNIILFIGSDFKRKGLIRLLYAVAALPVSVRAKTFVWVVGQDRSAFYQRVAHALKILDNIRFLGACRDIPFLLWSADCLVHPALREATGGVIVEAIVAGLPVIVSGICGFAEHVEKARAGIVLPEPFDQSALDRALERMLTSKERLQWSLQAKTYGITEDLYSRAEKSVTIIETVAAGLKDKKS